GFVHVLYQNALYASLRPTRKAAWSAAAARALLSRYGEKCAAVATELALLFEAARDPARAIDFFLLGARNEVRVAAHREAVGLARGQPDPVAQLLAHNVLQQPLFHTGELAAARHSQEQGLALYDRDLHGTLTAVYGEDPGVGCLVYGAATLWHLGYPEQAVRS